DTRLYMRGLGDEPFIHVTELGDPGHIGFGYHVADPAILHGLVASGAARRIETSSEPGGGECVVLHDPNGFAIELIHGRQRVAPVAPRSPLRLPGAASVVTGPSHVRRAVHCAIATPNLEETITWWRDTLGLLPTDELSAGDPARRIGLFLRLDRGE